MNKLYKYSRFILLTSIVFSSLIFSDITLEQEQMLETLPPDQRDAIRVKMLQADSISTQIEETFEEESTLVAKPERSDYIRMQPLCDDCIYGYDFFQYAPSTFAPSNNIAISSDYILGPGDKLKVNFYGSEETETEAYISREGVVVLPNLGPLNLLGMSFGDASEYIKNETSKKTIGASVSTSITELRSISVYVLGEAYKPGKYTMSGLSNVSNALFVSGGVSEKGSLRNIQIKRENKTISNYDFYDFLLNGSTQSDVRLQDGDVIFIPFIEKKVKVGGSFKRPHLYEFIEGETIKDAIYLAGGFDSDVVPNSSIELSSLDLSTLKRNLTYIPLDSSDLDRKLTNEDVINVASKSGVNQKTIKLTGEVSNPGEYSILEGDTILDIIQRAGGYTERGYSQGAIYLRKRVAEQQKKGFERSADQLENTIVDIITKASTPISQFALTPISNLVTKLREAEPLGRLIVDVDLLALKTDPLKNFRVQGGDSLYIPERPESVTVVGEVLNASTLSYNPSFNAKDYINRSGGMNDSADPGRIFIILPDGQSSLVKRSFFVSRNSILPGSTIVIPRDARPLDAINLTQIITPILADLATSAAAISVISD